MGQDYEVALCCLFFLRALRLSRGDFFLACNHDLAGIFDDVVLFYRLQGDQPHQHRAILLQAKHRDTTTNKKLTLSYPFSLADYFKSFKEIRRHWQQPLKVGSIEMQFQEIILVLYTNTGCEIGDAAFHVPEFKEVQHLRDLLNTGGRILKKVWVAGDRRGLPQGQETSDFLDHLILCTEQASVQDVDSILEEELRAVFKLKSTGFAKELNSKLRELVKAWWSDSGAARYLIAQSEEWKTIMEMAIRRLNRDTLNIHRQLNLKFTAAALEEVQVVHRCLKIIWICVTDEYQANAVRSRLFTAQRNSLIIGVQFLEDHLEEVKALWRNKICSTLVVDIVNGSPEEGSPLLQRLQEEVQSDAGRRLVVIAKGEPTSDEGWREVLPEPTWSVLQQVTRDRLLEAPVRLQGETVVALRDVVGSHVNDFMTDELISSVSVYEKTINLGTAMPAPLEYYVPRCLERKASKTVTYKSYQNTKSLLFSINYNLPLNDFTKGIKTLRMSDINSDSKIMRTTFVEGINNDSDIRRLCCTLRVPGLRGKAGLEGFTGKVTEFIPLTWTSEENIMVIEGPPGVGKSFFVTMMCHTVKEQFPGAWALRLDMGHHTEYIKETDFTEITDIKEFLMKSLSKEPNNLERQLLEHSLTVTGNVFLFLDAFDEVSPDYMSKCCHLLKGIALMFRYRQMVVTTRPVTTKDIEEALQTKAFTLPVFNVQEQDLFLKQFPAAKGMQVGEEEISVLRESAGPVLEIPLLCRMVSEGLLHHREQLFLKFQNPWRRVLLYDVFVEESVKQRVAEKHKLDVSKPALRSLLESSVKTHLQNLQELAVMKLMPRDQRHLLSELSEMPEEKLGLVVNTGGRVDFEHHTFAEYFLGCWLAYHWMDCPRDLLLDVLFRDGLEFVAATFSWSLFADGYPLHLAVAQGDEALVREHLAPGTTTTDRGGRSALHVAAMTQGEHHEVWELLMASGEDLNRKDDVLGANALKYVKISSNWEFVESALEKEETLGNCKYNSKQSTAMNNRKSLNKYILHTKRIYVYNFDNKGNTFLHLAAAKNSRGAMEILINRGHRLNVKNKSGFTPLHEAARQGHEQAVRLLAENGADLNKKDNQGNTALSWVAREGHHEVVKLLIVKGSDLNIKNNQGYTALSWAAREGHLEVVKLLLEKGSDLNIKNNQGTTALSGAAIKGHIEVVKLLSQKGCDLNIKNDYGNTALSWAAREGHVEVVKLLLEKGSDLNTKTEHGNTALAWAAMKGHPEVVKLLLERGSDLNINNDQGMTALSWAGKEGCLEVVKLLLEKGSDFNIKDNDGNTALSWAAIKGHHEVVKILLETGSDVNINNDQGMTALSWAGKEGHLEVVKVLLENGSDLNIKNNQGTTALSWAAIKGHLEVVQLLLEKGSDFNIKDNDGNTALSWAAIKGHLEVVKLLLEKGSDINIKDNDGNTELWYAAHEGHLEVVKILLEKGSDFNIKDNDGNTALSWAAREGHLEVVKLLLEKGFDVNKKNDEGNTALSWATIKGHLETVKLLLENGAYINIKTEHGNTVLSSAAIKGHLEVLKLLLEKGPDLNIKNDYGNTALSWAASKGHFEMVKLLLEKGSDLNIKTEHGNTALSWATIKGHLEVVKLLLKKGSDVNIRNDQGMTPLWWAAHKGHLEMMKLLLEKGSDFNIKDNDGNTALSRAALEGHLEVVKLLSEKGSDLNIKNNQGTTALSWAAIKGHLEVVKFLLEKGSDFNIKDNDGDTVLSCAAHEGRLEVVKLLLAKGIDLNIKNNQGNTALSFAASKGHLEVVKLLLEKGSDLNIKDNDGDTLLSCAAHEGHLEVVKLLLQKGSDLNIKNNQGTTALSWAAGKGHLDVVKLLLQKGSDLNIMDNDGDTASSRAAFEGHLEVVKLLLENGSDINIKNNHGTTALSWAASKGHIEVVKLLLENGSDLNIKDNDGDSALSCAAIKGHLEVVKLLLENGSDLNIKNNDGDTAMSLASRADRAEVVKFLKGLK